MTNEPPQLQLGVVLFDGFELLDVYGPLEMFGGLDGKIRLVLLAEALGPIRSAQGPASVAEASMLDPHEWDILLVPGGIGTRREVANSAFMEALVRQARSSKYLASVCTGSGLLAKAGLLDGKRATTNKRAFAWPKSQGPKVHWVPEARWVEEGNIFTSSGVSAGMDMALALIARICGRETSVQIAQRTEYEWHEDPAWDPFAKLNGLA